MRHRADVLAISVTTRMLLGSKTRVHCLLHRLSKMYTEKCKWVQALTIYKYDKDPTICPFRYLIYYIVLSNKFHKCNEDGKIAVHSLFITKSGKAASSDTCANWVKEVLTESGIDPSIYMPHSCHAAASSNNYHEKGYPLEIILAQGGWASNHAFMKFYNRKVWRGVCHHKSIEFPVTSVQGSDPILNEFTLYSNNGTTVTDIYTKYSKYRADNSHPRCHPVLPKYIRTTPVTAENGLAFLGVHQSPSCAGDTLAPPIDDIKNPLSPPPTPVYQPPPRSSPE